MNEGIHALVLAGGESRRMGEPKLLLAHAGKTLLALAVAKARAVCAQTWVVVGAYPELYASAAQAAGAEVVHNPDWTEGLASSLRAGVAALPEGAEAALVVLPDMPLVPEAHLRALLAAGRGEARLVLSRYAGSGVLGAPALLGAPLFGVVQSLRGEQGARKLLATLPASAWESVDLADPDDVDTPDDARRVLPRA